MAGRRFLDTDDAIRTLTGKTAREIWDEGGAELFKQKETEACAFAFDQKGSKQVIATGGGIADNPDACALLASHGTLVFLNVPFQVLFSRVMQSAQRDGRLPGFLQGGDPELLFAELFARRSKIYATICDIRIDAGTRSPSEITREIMELTLHEQ